MGKVHEITYGKYTFSDDCISSGGYNKEKTLDRSDLSIDTLTATIRCNDPSILDFTVDTPVIYRFSSGQSGTYYLRSIEWMGPSLYKLNAASPMIRLASIRHVGGIYTGQTVDEVVRDICGGIPVLVKTVLADIKLYGWLPLVTDARSNLSQVLFAIGAYLGVDRNGVLRVEPLWDGCIGWIGADRMYQGGQVKRGSNPISQVTVTEHQYVAGTEEKQLFDGTTQQGDIITFDEPMHDLSATGFAILESGANYAKLSAGTGTLTGKAYIHNTRQITERVAERAIENVKSITDKTLVSLVNSRSVARQLAEYYLCTDIISNPIVVNQERSGHVVAVYHPYKQEMVKACIQSMEVEMSSFLKSGTEVLVGFLPPQPEKTEYFNTREVLTGSGTWTKPEGVQTVSYVLISGGQGGKCGRPGEAGGAAEAFSYSVTSPLSGAVTGRETGYRYGPAGKGGAGGEPGKGGRILQGSIDVSALSTITYKCGVGGLGAVYDANNLDAEGSLGGDTTFGDLSTASGVTSDSGYTDVTTGQSYATAGKDGLPGGDSAGKVDGQSVTADNVQEFTPAPSITDWNGNVWTGGETPTDGTTSEGVPKIKISLSAAGYLYAAVSYALGSGAAAGANGSPGTEKGTVSVSSTRARAYSVPGVAGASAALVPAKAGLTIGGDGGYGGGGGSPCGLAAGGMDGTTSGDIAGEAAEPGPGGAGAQGGQGGDGIIILYYSVVKTTGVRAAADSDFKWRLDKYGRRCIV